MFARNDSIKKRKQAGWCIRMLLKSNLFVIVGIFLFQSILGILQTANVVITQKIVKLVQQPDSERLIFFICIWGVIEILKKTAPSLTEILGLRLQAQIFLTFYKQVCDKLHRLSILKYDESEFLVRLERTRRAIDEKIADYIRQIFSLISLLITIGSLGVVLSGISPFYLIYFIIMSVLQNTILILNSRDTVNLFANQDKKQHKERYYKELLQNRTYAKEIRSYDCYKWLIGKRLKNYRSIIHEHLQFSKKWSIINIFTGMLLYFLEGSILVILFLQLYNQTITADIVILVIQAQELFCGTIFSCVGHITSLREDFSYIISLLQIMNEKEMEEVKHCITDNGFRMQNICYSYNSDKCVLKNIDLTIHDKEKIAIVGRNGSGKSTLAKIVMGLLEPTSGKIIVNTNKKMAIFQDFSKFYLTVKENILPGVINIENNKIEDFCKNNRGLDFLFELPAGLDTHLGPDLYEDGIDLSGGEWQKISILRALLMEADLVVFDEPTAALDPLSERAVFQEIQELLKDKTVIIITHRIGLTKFADNIVFLEKGEIVENGTYEKLLTNSHGWFKRYCYEQGKWYV
ncbi:ABC transporter ATP-binding protein [Hominisplanchenecus murintestinalis]|uniref:ABC transporter ATP-binding protein n=2 Tax=Lachnospiraceae TaxID=186803 RepID=A0AC61RTP5_9FIRM|nr:MULTISPECIES: ABC transporter ATP-binding protein [Lachnospiraceae]TGX99105.1 ABC transporter ATP-binding protein [Hominisplanchenecus murintestinalis]TGY95050.1 ABC transporter ATP-binding protein [Petralouisia muris]